MHPSDLCIHFKPQALQNVLPEELALLEALLPEMLEEFGFADAPDDQPESDSPVSVMV